MLNFVDMIRLCTNCIVITIKLASQVNINRLSNKLNTWENNEKVSPQLDYNINFPAWEEIMEGPALVGPREGGPVPCPTGRELGRL